MSDKLKVDIGIYEDPEGEEDMGFFRGPRIIRQRGESYKDFRIRILAEAQTLVDNYNTGVAAEKKIEKAVAKEREACARECEARAQALKAVSNSPHITARPGVVEMAEECALFIRGRANPSVSTFDGISSEGE